MGESRIAVCVATSAAVAGALILTACGGGSDSSADTATTQFGPPITSAIGSDQTGSVVFGDFNGDGKVDFFIQGQRVIFAGRGDGSFQAAGTVAGAISPWVAADFNGDGNLDIAGCATFQSVAVALGNGDLTFGTPVESPVPFTLSGGVQVDGCQEGLGVAVGDFDGDGKLDLIVPLNGNVLHDSSVTVLFGNGDGTFRTGPVQVIASGRAVIGFAVSDLNRDGKLDLLVATVGNDFATSGGTLQIHLGRGGGTFGAPLYPSFSGLGAGTPNLPAIADFNGDGIPDYALTASITRSSQIGAPRTFSIFPGNGDGTVRASTYSIDTNKVGVTGYAAADLNGDGAPDLALSVQFATPEAPGTVLYRLRILYDNGDGSMRDPVDYPLQAASGVAGIIDVNGDGIPDVVLRSGTDVIVFTNTSRGARKP